MKNYYLSVLLLFLVNNYFCGNIYGNDSLNYDIKKSAYIKSTGNNKYVSVDGDDSNSGTFGSPYKTIDYAITKLEASDTLFIRGGSYFVNVNRDKLKGKSDSPIVICGYEREEVIIDGTILIESEWKQDEGNIYKTTIAEDIWQLFVDNSEMVMARWPNAQFSDKSIYDHYNWAKASHVKENTNGHMVVASPNLAETGVDVTGAMLVANVASFKTYTTQVTSHNSNHNEFDYKAVSNFKNNKNKFFLECKKELIDSDNEWYFNKDTKELFIYGNPTGKVIRGKVQTYSFELSNSAYIKFRNLTFFGTTISTKLSKNITIENCSFEYPSCSKRMLGATGAPSTTRLLVRRNKGDEGNYVVRNCTFRNIDGEGMFLNGRHNIVENCLFENIDFSCGSISFLQSTITCDGYDFIFRHNTVRTAGASETIYGRHAGFQFSYNDISNTGLAQNDGAIIQGGGGNTSGSRIFRNWLHDTRKSGIRFDAVMNKSALGGRNGMVYQNVTWNAGGYMIKGDKHKVYNNTSFGRIIIINESMEDPNNPGELLYSNPNTVTKNNLASRISGHRRKSVNDGGGAVIPGNNSNNVFSKSSEGLNVGSLLMNPDQLDFRPKYTSDNLLNKGVTDESDSNLTNNYVGSAPDIGAYEVADKNYWIPGRMLKNASRPIPSDNSETQIEKVDLIWLKAYESINNDIYFGNSYDDVNSATKESKEYKGRQQNNIYNPGKIIKGQTYFWRVDGVKNNSVVKGDTWSFVAGVDANANLPDDIVKFTIRQDNINVYPNPVTQNLNINIEDNNAVLRIYTLTGKKVLKKQLQKGTNIIDTAEFSEGMYTVQIKLSNSIYSKKIIKK